MTRTFLKEFMIQIQKSVNTLIKTKIPNTPSLWSDFNPLIACTMIWNKFSESAQSCHSSGVFKKNVIAYLANICVYFWYASKITRTFLKEFMIQIQKSVNTLIKTKIPNTPSLWSDFNPLIACTMIWNKFSESAQSCHSFGVFK